MGDQQGYDQDDGARDHQAHRADRHVERALDGSVDTGQTVAAHADEGHAIDGVDVDPRAHDVEQVGDDLEVDLLVLAQLDQT